MFQDYNFLHWLFGQIQKNIVKNGKNKLHEHLEWLLAQGENKPSVIICPQCNKRLVKFISVCGNSRYGYTMSINYVCCDNQSCMDELSELANYKNCFLPLKFSSILWFSRKQDQKQFVDLLRQIYEVPERITREWAFKFFASS